MNITIKIIGDDYVKVFQESKDTFETWFNTDVCVDGVAEYNVSGISPVSIEKFTSYLKVFSLAPTQNIRRINVHLDEDTELENYIKFVKVLSSKPEYITAITMYYCMGGNSELMWFLATILYGSKIGYCAGVIRELDLLFPENMRGVGRYIPTNLFGAHIYFVAHASINYLDDDLFDVIAKKYKISSAISGQKAIDHILRVYCS